MGYPDAKCLKSATGRVADEGGRDLPDDSGSESQARKGRIDARLQEKPKRARDQPHKCSACGLKRSRKDRVLEHIKQMKEAVDEGVKLGHQGATAVAITQEGPEKGDGAAEGDQEAGGAGGNEGGDESAPPAKRAKRSRANVRCSVCGWVARKDRFPGHVAKAKSKHGYDGSHDAATAIEADTLSAEATIATEEEAGEVELADANAGPGSNAPAGSDDHEDMSGNKPTGFPGKSQKGEAEALGGVASSVGGNEFTPPNDEAKGPGKEERIEGGTAATESKGRDGPITRPAHGSLDKEDEILAHVRYVSACLAGIPCAPAPRNQGPATMDPPDGMQSEGKEDKFDVSASAQTPAELLAHYAFLEDCPFEVEDEVSKHEAEGLIRCIACDSVFLYKLGETAVAKARWRETKKALKKHLKNANHVHHAENWKKTQAAKALEQDKMAIAERAVGSAWLHIFQRGYSRASGPELIAMLAKNGVEVGDIRHGQAFGIKMLDAMYDQTRANLRAFLPRATDAAGRPPVVAYPFDKLTIDRRTILMVGGTMFVSGEMRAVYVDAPLTGVELSGKELLQRVRDVVSQLSPMTTESIAGFPCDGELVEKCAHHADEVLGESNDWLHFPWDFAHGEELACKDAQREWLRGLNATIVEMNKAAGWGKKYEEMRQLAEEMEEMREGDEGARLLRWYAPLLFSATRWAAHESRVYNNFIRNYPIMTEAYRQASEAITPQTNVPTAGAVRAAEALRKLDNVDFAAKLACVCDIANRKAKLSGLLQKVGAMPWEKVEIAEETAAALAEDAKDLRAAARTDLLVLGPDGAAETLLPCESRWPMLRSCWADLTAAEPKFQQRSLRGARADVISACDEVAQYAEQLSGALLKRVKVNLHWSTTLASECFATHVLTSPDLKRAQYEALDAMVTKFQEYVELPGRGDILRQYRDLRMAISSKAPGKAAWRVAETASRTLQRQDLGEESGDESEAPDGPTATMNLVRDIFTDPEIHGKSKDVVFLLETCALKSSVESVVESMGSVIKRHNMLGPKSHKWLNKEVFVAWCTPKAYTDAADDIIHKAAQSASIQFTRKAPERKTAAWGISKVVDRLRAHGHFAEIHAAPK